jgi:hypothetical protein
MNKSELSRRNFISRPGSLAFAFRLASVPATAFASEMKNFTIDGSSHSDPQNNLFANNEISASRRTDYPLLASHPQKGNIAGPDMAFPAPDAYNVVAWNCFSSPDSPSTNTEPKTQTCGDGESSLQVHNDPSRKVRARNYHYGFFRREKRFHQSTLLQLRPGGEDRT